LLRADFINADKAFDTLPDTSRHNGRRLVEVAEAVVESQLLLLPKQSLGAEDASQL